MLRAEMTLDEVERVERIAADMEGLEAAWRTAYAMSDTKELAKAGRELRRRFKLVRATGRDRAAEMDGLARFQKAQRILRRRAKRKG